MLDDNNQNTLQLPFEYHHVPDFGSDFIKSGKIVSTDDSMGLVLCLCTKGSIDIESGLNSYSIKEKEIYFYSPAGFLHILNISDDFTGLVIKPKMDFILPLIYNLLNVRTQMYIRDHPKLSMTDQQYEYITEIMSSMEERINHEMSSDMEERRRMVLTELIKSQASTLFYEILNMYLINQPIELSAPDRNDEIMQKFMVSLDLHYRQERNVAFYAAEQCLSYSYFSEIIKSKTGVTALKWIISRVIIDSKQMLEFTNISIKEIADKLNFPTQTFFGKYFKQYVGISPKEYRKRCKNRKGDVTANKIEIDLYNYLRNSDTKSEL